MNKQKGPIFLSVMMLAASMIFFTNTARSDTIFQTTDFIIGIEGRTYEFLAEIEPLLYKATLSDLCFGPLEFDYIGFSVSTASEKLGSIDGPGNIVFNVTPDTAYFVSIFGVGTGDYDTGLFGLNVETVPLPPSILFLGIGLVGFVGGLRRRVT